MTPDLWQMAAMAAVGLLGGLAGGMLGVGGSVIMIPGLVLLFGQTRHEGYNQHVYQAAAMIANVAVAFPAMLRHRRAGALVPAVLRVMIPMAVLASLAGVWMSNLAVFKGADGGIWLGRLLAVFLMYVAGHNLWQARQPRLIHEGEPLAPRITAGRSAGVGAGMGVLAGLLGVGGGILAVPFQQVLMRLPLRSCIANSSAVICVSAATGAVMKNWTLPQHHAPATMGLMLAAILAPTCWIGGRLGASLTHRLPLRQIRIAFAVLMVISACRLANLPWL